LPDPAITRQLRAFLAQWQRPLVLADSELDFNLLAHALSDFGMPDLPPAPSYRPMLVTFGDMLMRVEDYFELHPDRARTVRAGRDAQTLFWPRQIVGRRLTPELSRAAKRLRLE
jgi:hypothetical protein